MTSKKPQPHSPLIACPPSIQANRGTPGSRLCRTRNFLNKRQVLCRLMDRSGSLSNNQGSRVPQTREPGQAKGRAEPTHATHTHPAAPFSSSPSRRAGEAKVSSNPELRRNSFPTAAGCSQCCSQGGPSAPPARGTNADREINTRKEQQQQQKTPPQTHKQKNTHTHTQKPVESMKWPSGGKEMKAGVGEAVPLPIRGRDLADVIRQVLFCCFKSKGWRWEEGEQIYNKVRKCVLFTKTFAVGEEGSQKSGASVDLTWRAGGNEITDTPS